MAAAEREIGFVATDFHLIAFGQDVSLCVLADNHGCFAAAMVDLADLEHLICDGQECGGFRKERASEIDAEVVAKGRDIEIVDHAGQLPDLFDRQKLRFVDEDASDRANCAAVCGFVK